MSNDDPLGAITEMSIAGNWLITHKDVYAYQFKGKRYDIGTLD